MAIVTRTINPLPLQDLEPRRFEDLIRQLAYDFRDWQKLEATGRAGSDDGFDARGLELVPSTTVPSSIESEDGDREGDDVFSPPMTRSWLIQCKREVEIGPKKLLKYVEAFGSEPLYGVILAAACNFSKKARDAFEVACRSKGYAEVYLWGRAEIEDALFQPKNDHLLFAYFGISLRVRRRSIQSGLRATFATKKTLRRVLKNSDKHYIVFRLVDSCYPKLPDKARQSWIATWSNECSLTHEGVRVQYLSYQAYVSDDGQSWDAANLHGLQRDQFHFGRWGKAEEHPLQKQADAQWSALESKNQGWMHSDGLISYDRILAMDEVGDEFFEGSIVYVEPTEKGLLFEGYWVYVRPNQSWLGDIYCPVDESNRVAKFAAELRHHPKAQAT